MIKDEITFPDFVKLDLRVGTITEAETIEGSERLVKLQIDLGEEIGMRQVIAGIAQFYQTEVLVDRQVVVLVNLETRKMMGQESQGMVIAAGDKEAVLLAPEKPVVNGTIIR